MTMPADYEITQTQDYTYLDAANQVIQGKRVWFKIIAYNEVHFVNAPTLSAATPLIVQQVAERKALGGPTK